MLVMLFLYRRQDIPTLDGNPPDSSLRRPFASSSSLDRVEVSFRDFPSLQDIIQRHKNLQVLALYFAASWCPMSRLPSQWLDDLFPQQHPSLQSNATLVYISSDATLDDFDNYVRPGWLAVPFHKSLERSHLKRYFGTCAKREMKELGLTQSTRKHEIPHLVIVSASTGHVLSSDGLAHVREQGASALSYWHDLWQADVAATANRKPTIIRSRMT